MKHLLLFFISSIPVWLHAQILNIDRIDTADYVKKAVWKGNIALALEVDKQKTTLFDASNFFDVGLQQHKELFIFSASDRFTYNGSQDFLNEGFAHLRWRHGYKNRLQPETYTQYQWDHKRGMLNRFVSGMNARYDFWYKRQWEIAVGTGLMVEQELWDYEGVDSAKIPPNPVNQTFNKVKSNTYIKWEGRVSPSCNISIVFFYQATFAHFFQPRVASSFRFNADISRRFAFGANFQGLFDASPVVPIFHFYYSFSNSVMYRF